LPVTQRLQRSHLRVRMPRERGLRQPGTVRGSRMPSGVPLKCGVRRQGARHLYLNDETRRRSSVRLRLLLAVALAVLLGGCVATMPQGQAIPAAPTDYEFDIESPRAHVFEALLSVAQSLNLSVDVLEKESGFIQFRNSALAPSQLDQFCKYPVVKPGTTVPWDTFQGWNQRSLKQGGGSVSGNVALNVLLSESGTGTHAKLHSTWVASNRNETSHITSKGVLERDFENSLRNKLNLPPKTS